jgi:YD repeat-containing protein
MLGLLPVRPSRSDVVRLATVVATVDPTIIDDADDGYRVGQRWVNDALLTTWTLADATPGAAVWVQEDGGGGGGGGPVALGGDLGGTSSNGYAKTVRGVSGTPTYDGNGRLSVLTTAFGTKTYTYDGSGKLTNITGTGIYRSKVISYSGGKFAGITVS